jgi:hypothetical protein
LGRIDDQYPGIVSTQETLPIAIDWFGSRTAIPQPTGSEFGNDIQGGHLPNPAEALKAAYFDITAKSIRFNLLTPRRENST